MESQIRFYGWVPDLPDRRDQMYAAPYKVLQSLPPKFDLRDQSPCFLPDVYDQGQLQSCTANAIAAAIEFDRKKQGLPDFIPSRLFIWANERIMEHTLDSNCGASLRDGIKSVVKQGACPESEWPYDPPKFAVKPPPQCYRDALKDLVTSYSSLVQNLDQLRGCLFSGYPVIFGFSVYESFESPEVGQSGIVPMPQPTEARVGGHAVVAVGYDDGQQRFVVRNSWGDTWGMKGYCTMPYAYLTDPNLSDDFWTIRVVSGR